MASSRVSAGILVWRERQGRTEVFLGHPGGPFWARKDRGAWSIPKGQLDPGEDPLQGARREFREETGVDLPGPFEPLGEVVQRSGKRVVGFASPAELDPAHCASNNVTLEWPARSGRTIEFPELDRVSYFDLSEAARRINPAQVAFLERLEASLLLKRRT